MRVFPGKTDCLVLDFTVTATTGLHVSESLRHFVPDAESDEECDEE